jgi:hypothetical protein
MRHLERNAYSFLESCQRTLGHTLNFALGIGQLVTYQNIC